jgi:DNA-binding NarL/FixJ family response regulator
MPEEPISVFLVDDHTLVRRGFRRLLEDDPESEWLARPATGMKR